MVVSLAIYFTNIKLHILSSTRPLIEGIMFLDHDTREYLEATCFSMICVT